MTARLRRPAGSERGAVTAELAMALPVLLALVVGLVWLLSLGAAQVRTVDAAREAARALARGDDADSSLALARRVAPEGATVGVTGAGEGGDDVVVEVQAPVEGPGGLFGFLPAVTVHAEAHAVREETGAAP